MSKRRIRISKIENKMLDAGCEIAIINSLSEILYDCLCCGENLKNSDKSSLALVLKERIACLKNRFDKIELILKI